MKGEKITLALVKPAKPASGNLLTMVDANRKLELALVTLGFTPGRKIGKSIGSIKKLRQATFWVHFTRFAVLVTGCTPPILQTPDNDAIKGPDIRKGAVLKEYIEHIRKLTNEANLVVFREWQPVKILLTTEATTG